MKPIKNPIMKPIMKPIKSPAYSPTFEFSLMVYDSVSELPVTPTYAVLWDGVVEYSAYSFQEGVILFSGVPAGGYLLTVNAVGYLEFVDFRIVSGIDPYIDPNYIAMVF